MVGMEAGQLINSKTTDTLCYQFPRSMDNPRYPDIFPTACTLRVALANRQARARLPRRDCGNETMKYSSAGRDRQEIALTHQDALEIQNGKRVHRSHLLRGHRPNDEYAVSPFRYRSYQVP